MVSELGAAILTGSLENNVKPQTIPSLEEAEAGDLIVHIKGKWNRDDASSTSTREVGTCIGNGECITIYHDENNKITDVVLHNGIIISGGDIEITQSGNEYNIHYTN